YPCDLPADDKLLVPRDVASAINEMMRKHGRIAIASAVCVCVFTPLDIATTDVLAPGYYATMGYGVPAAFGLQAAGGERPLVLVGHRCLHVKGWQTGKRA